VVRLPATDPDARIGSLLLNPGGPGGSGVELAVFFGPFIGQVYGSEVRARYDIVGVDPRGIVRSTPLRCFDSEDEWIDALPPRQFPLTRREVRGFVRADRALADACRREAGAIGRHMSTANVARDLDVLRARLGDERLHYLGFSYGSYLGVTYANLFPERVGALVVDAVLDPIAWANRGGKVPFSTRLRSDEGAQETLDELFRLCEAAGPQQCALAPDAAERFAALAERVREQPVVFVDPDTGDEVLVDYQMLIGTTLGALYDPFIYPELADLLAALEEQAGPAQIAEAFGRLDDASAMVSRDDFPEFPEYYNAIESLPGVACSDSDNPDRYAAWVRAGARADAKFGYFGRIWTWVSSPCAQWPFADRNRYTGPFTAETANPVLVVGNLYDPATRYEGAQTVRALLQDSALLTVDAPGHASLGLSACAGALTGRYLLDPSTAPEIDGTTCAPEFNPFELGAQALAADGGVQPELRREVLPNIAFPPPRRTTGG
jgi:pimeloyl-ACP methyl ester carboxylesterase